MASINEEARIPVYINDEQAKSALITLQGEAEKWRRKMYEAMSSGDLKGMKDAERELKNVNKQVSQLKKDAFDVNKVLDNLSSASMKDLRKTVQQLNREMDGLNRDTKEYAALKEKLQLVRTEMGGINKTIREQRGLISKTADFVNRYWSIITGAGATLVGVKMTIDKATESFGNFEERVDNLSALTGLAGENLEWLEDRAKKLSTSTLEGGIRVKQGAQEIIDAFTKTGSARPELLKNKEALSAVTEEAIILSNAAKTDLQPGIEALTMMLNQFNAPASDSRRIINALAAGSKEGAGEIPYLTTAVEKSGTVAADAKLNYETLIATIETLAPRITQAEIAGRSLKGVILDMQKGADDINPSIVGWTNALENLRKKNLSVTELTTMFGTENITTAKILLNNVDELKRYETAVTGTNVAIEQATINTDNRNAKLAQAKNRLENVRIELGEKLAPVMTFSTSSSTYFLKAISALVQIFFKYKSVILTAATAITTYTVVTKLAVMWKERENKATLANIVAGKLQALAYNAQFAAVSLYNAAVALLSGNMAKASIQFRAFSAALKANPVGLLASVVTTAAVAFWAYSKRIKQTADASKRYRDMLKEEKELLKGYSSEIVTEKNNLNSLVESILSVNDDETERKILIQQLKKEFPDFLKGIDSETVSNEQLRIKLDQINTLYGEKIRLAALQAKIQAINNASVKAEERKLEIEDRLVEIEKERYKLGDKKADKEVKSLTDEYNNLTTALAGYEKKRQDLSVRSATLKQSISEYDTVEYYTKQLEGLEKSQKIYQSNLEKASESGNQEEIAHYQKQIDLTNQQITLFKNRKKELEDAAKNSKSGHGSTGEETEAEQSLIKIKEQELEQAKKMPEATVAEITAKNKKIAAIEKEIQRYKELGTEKEKVEGKSLSDLKKDASKIKTEEDPELDITWAYSQADKEAEEFAKKKRTEEEWTKFLDKQIQERIDIQQKEAEIEKEIQTAREELKETQINAIGEIAGALSGMFKDNSAAYIAFFAVQKAAAIADIWVNYAKELSFIAVTAAEMNAASFGTAGTIWGAIQEKKALVNAIANTAVVGAQAISGFYEGGSTGSGDKYEVAGVVHKNEYVIPSEGTKNPGLKPVIDILEIARRNGSLARLDLRPIVQMVQGKQMYTGGYSSGSGAVSSSGQSNITQQSSLRDPELTAAINNMTKATALLMKQGVQFPIVSFRKKYKDIDDLLNQTGMGGF